MVKLPQPTKVGGHKTPHPFPAAPGVAPLPGTTGDQGEMYIHATGGTLMQSQEDTQRALVAGETRSRVSVEAEVMLWISECHASLPPADSVHWTTHLRSRIPALLEKLG